MNAYSAVALALIALATRSTPDMAHGHAVKEPTQVTAYPLKQVDAATVVKKLKTLTGSDVQLVSDDASNTVFIRARPERIPQIKKILYLFDIVMPRHLTVISLHHADVARTADRLNAILTLTAFCCGDDRPTRVIGDERGKTIIIWAAPEMMPMAWAILRWLDAKDQ